MGSCDRGFIQILLCSSAGRDDGRRVFAQGCEPSARGPSSGNLQQRPRCGRDAGDASLGPVLRARSCCSVPWTLLVRFLRSCRHLEGSRRGCETTARWAKAVHGTRCHVHMRCIRAPPSIGDPQQGTYPSIGEVLADQKFPPRGARAGIGRLVRGSRFCSKVLIARGPNGPALEGIGTLASTRRSGEHRHGGPKATALAVVVGLFLFAPCSRGS